MSYINTETKKFNISEAEIRALFPYTMFGIPFVAPRPYAWVFPSPPPDFDQRTQYVREIDPVLTAKGHYEQTWEVVELSAEQIALNTDPEIEELANAVIIANKVEQLWMAADHYVTSYISGVAIGILTIGVIQRKLKCIAVSDWSNEIWSEYYTRKAAITVDSVLDLDFSSFGSIPFPIPELKMEVFG